MRTVEIRNATVILYHVRWKGYGPHFDTWEPEYNLQCPLILQRFHKRQCRAKTLTTTSVYAGRTSIEIAAAYGLLMIASMDNKVC